jgi:hypothetical protein
MQLFIVIYILKEQIFVFTVIFLLFMKNIALSRFYLGDFFLHLQKFYCYHVCLIFFLIDEFQ